MAKYSYLADGTKNSAMTSAGTGYIYAGTFVYRRDSTGVLSFESAPISMERMTANGGKEDQSVDFSVPFTDFGALHYSPSLQRWLVPDPLSEKYYDVSPYAYCAGDPVNLVDEVGMKHQEEGVMSLSQDSHRNANVTQENIEHNRTSIFYIIYEKIKELF